jgi:hypothetical protein
LGIEPSLHAGEQLGIDDRFVLAFMNETLVNDLAAMDPVAQEVEQRPAAERQSAHGPAFGGYVELGEDPAALEIALQSVD